MGYWIQTKNGNVISTKPGKSNKHKDLYVGTYENALNHFGVDENSIQNYGELINIVIYRQTSEFTIPMLTNELYDLLVDAQSEHKYWAPKDQRHNNAIKTLQEAKSLHLLFDDQIIKTLSKSTKRRSQQRLYFYDKWIELNGEI